jgi:hypothetical protein
LDLIPCLCVCIPSMIHTTLRGDPCVEDDRSIDRLVDRAPYSHSIKPPTAPRNIHTHAADPSTPTPAPTSLRQLLQGPDDAAQQQHNPLDGRKDPAPKRALLRGEEYLTPRTKHEKLVHTFLTAVFLAVGIFVLGAVACCVVRCNGQLVGRGGGCRYWGLVGLGWVGVGSIVDGWGRERPHIPSPCSLSLLTTSWPPAPRPTDQFFLD